MSSRVWPSLGAFFFVLGAWLWALGAVGASAQGQRSDDGALTEEPPRYVRTQWTVDDGLPVNSINDIAQGPDGYLWLATYDGLARFDGKDFRVYRSGKQSGLPSNRILTLLVRPDGIWMHTESRHVVRLREGTFTTVTEGVDLIHEGENGRLWAGADERTMVYKNGSFQSFDESQTRTLRALLVEEDGTMWKGTSQDGLYRRMPDGRVQHLTEEDGLTGRYVWTLEKGEDGRIWIGVAGGLHRWEDGSLVDVPVVAGGPESIDVLHVEPDVGGDCLVAAKEGVFQCEDGRLVPIIQKPFAFSAPTFAGGLAQVGPSGEVWINAQTEVYRGGTPVFETDRRVRNVFFDREGNVWIGTTGDGLFRLRPSPFVMYGEPEGLASSNIYPIEQREDGSVWLGTLGGGVARVGAAGDVETYRPVKNGRVFDNVWALHEDRSGRLLMSGGSGRLCEFAEGGCARPDTESPIHARVRAIYEDRRGRLWVGSENRGLYRCDTDCLTNSDAWTQFTPTNSTLPHSHVRTIHESPEGTIWVGTNGGGVARYREGTFEPLTTDDGLSSNLVRDIYQDTTEADASSVLWAVTEDQGLNRVKLGSSDTSLVASTVVYREEEGLYDNSVHQILKDEQGRFWLSSNRGLFWTQKAELEAFARGEIGQVSSVSYTTEEGLRSREANGGVQPAGLRAQDGRLWFPTQEGAAVIDPATIPTDIAPPPVHVETVMSGDSVLHRGADAPLRLAASQRDFDIEYTGIRLANPVGVTFRYRLQGLQREWREVGSRRRAYFTNVPPGQYTFEVAAQTRGGQWSDVPAQLSVTVAPYFYETWWFYGLCIVVLGAIGYGGVRYRLYALQRRQELLEEKVAERTRELRRTSAQLEALFERSPDMVKIHDAEGNVLRANPRYFEEMGYREEELIGMKVWALDPSISPQDAAKLWGEMEIGDRHRFESILRRKDGSTFPVEVHIRRLRLNGDDRFMAITRDITERKEAERELERENERLDRFASVLSHDLRNPLNVAQGRLQLANEASDDPDVHLSKAAEALGRMDEIIQDTLLLTWSERDIDPEDLEMVDLGEAACEAWENVEAPQATFEMAAPARLRCHEGRLRRLLENLFRNAVEHGGDAVTITAGSLQNGSSLKENFSEENFSKEESPEGFFVEDDGPGIPEEKREKVLEGGFSSLEEGTGLGLSIVQGIAKAHGWSLSVTESREGGARFEVRDAEMNGK